MTMEKETNEDEGEGDVDGVQNEELTELSFKIGRGKERFSSN